MGDHDKYDGMKEKDMMPDQELQLQPQNQQDMHSRQSLQSPHLMKNKKAMQAPMPANGFAVVDDVRLSTEKDVENFLNMEFKGNLEKYSAEDSQKELDKLAELLQQEETGKVKLTVGMQREMKRRQHLQEYNRLRKNTSWAGDSDEMKAVKDKIAELELELNKSVPAGQLSRAMGDLLQKYTEADAACVAYLSNKKKDLRNKRAVLVREKLFGLRNEMTEINNLFGRYMDSNRLKTNGVPGGENWDNIKSGYDLLLAAKLVRAETNMDLQRQKRHKSKGEVPKITEEEKEQYFKAPDTEMIKANFSMERDSDNYLVTDQMVRLLVDCQPGAFVREKGSDEAGLMQAFYQVLQDMTKQTSAFLPLANFGCKGLGTVRSRRFGEDPEPTVCNQWLMIRQNEYGQLFIRCIGAGATADLEYALGATRAEILSRWRGDILADQKGKFEKNFLDQVERDSLASLTALSDEEKEKKITIIRDNCLQLLTRHTGKRAEDFRNFSAKELLDLAQHTINGDRSQSVNQRLEARREIQRKNFRGDAATRKEEERQFFLTKADIVFGPDGLYADQNKGTWPDEKKKAYESQLHEIRRSLADILGIVPFELETVSADVLKDIYDHYDLLNSEKTQMYSHDQMMRIICKAVGRDQLTMADVAQVQINTEETMELLRHHENPNDPSVIMGRKTREEENAAKKQKEDREFLQQARHTTVAQRRKQLKDRQNAQNDLKEQLEEVIGRAVELSWMEKLMNDEQGQQKLLEEKEQTRRQEEKDLREKLDKMKVQVTQEEKYLNRYETLMKEKKEQQEKDDHDGTWSRDEQKVIDFFADMIYSSDTWDMDETRNIPGERIRRVFLKHADIIEQIFTEIAPMEADEAFKLIGDVDGKKAASEKEGLEREAAKTKALTYIRSATLQRMLDRMELPDLGLEGGALGLKNVLQEWADEFSLKIALGKGVHENVIGGQKLLSAGGMDKLFEKYLSPREFVEKNILENEQVRDLFDMSQLDTRMDEGISKYAEIARDQIKTYTDMLLGNDSEEEQPKEKEEKKREEPKEQAQNNPDQPWKLEMEQDPNSPTLSSIPAIKKVKKGKLYSAEAEQMEQAGKEQLEKLMESVAQGKSGQGLFLKYVIEDYFSGISTMDKRSMIAGAVRNVKAVKKETEEEKNRRLEKEGNLSEKEKMEREESRRREVIGNYLGGFLKGAGPLLQKTLQGVPTDAIPKEMKQAFEDVKSNLQPIPDRIVRAQIASMVERSNGVIERIEVVESKGAASVGQAFLCKMYKAGGADPEDIIIKLLRPDAKHRMEREKAVFIRAAEKVGPGMMKTFMGRLKSYEDELDLTKESDNVIRADVYDQKIVNGNLTGNKLDKDSHVSSEKLEELIKPTTTSMAIKRSPGTTVDKYLAEVDERVKNYLSLTIDYEPVLKEDGTLFNYKVNTASLDAREKVIKELNALQKRQEDLVVLAQKWVLEALYGTGFYHGDLHAGNIMVSDGGATVIDFGNATQLSYEERSKVSCMMFGAVIGEADLFRQGFHALMSKDEQTESYYQSKKAEFTKVLNKIFALGNESASAERITVALMKAQELGLEIPSQITKFSECQMRLQNTINAVNRKVQQLQHLARSLNPYHEVLEKGRMNLMGAMHTVVYLSESEDAQNAADYGRLLLIGQEGRIVSETLLDGMDREKEENKKAEKASEAAENERNEKLQYASDILSRHKELINRTGGKEKTEFPTALNQYHGMKNALKQAMQQLNGLEGEKKDRQIQKIADLRTNLEECAKKADELFKEEAGILETALRKKIQDDISLGSMDEKDRKAYKKLLEEQERLYSMERAWTPKEQARQEEVEKQVDEYKKKKGDSDKNIESLNLIDSYLTGDMQTMTSLVGQLAYHSLDEIEKMLGEEYLGQEETHFRKKFEKFKTRFIALNDAAKSDEEVWQEHCRAEGTEQAMQDIEAGLMKAVSYWENWNAGTRIDAEMVKGLQMDPRFLELYADYQKDVYDEKGEVREDSPVRVLSILDAAEWLGEARSEEGFGKAAEKYGNIATFLTTDDGLFRQYLRQKGFSDDEAKNFLDQETTFHIVKGCAADWKKGKNPAGKNTEQTKAYLKAITSGKKTAEDYLKEKAEVIAKNDEEYERAKEQILNDFAGDLKTETLFKTVRHTAQDKQGQDKLASFQHTGMRNTGEPDDFLDVMGRVLKTHKMDSIRMLGTWNILKNGSKVWHARK